METTRREILAGASTVSLLMLAGCSALAEPNPRVTDTQTSQGIGDIFTGGGTIHVLVINDGSSGDVEVTLTFYDSRGNVVGGSQSKVVNISEDESRRVDFDVSPPRGAERYEAEAESAGGLL